MRKLIQIALSGMLCLCMLLSGCTVQKTKIAYTVYPVGFLVDRLTGGLLESESIQNNGIVQRATIRDDYKDILNDSAVFLHIGQLEPYLTLYGQDISNNVDQQLDLSSMNAVYEFQRYTQVVTDGEITYVESPYYRGDEFSMIDTDVQDLYLWTDPISMLSMAKNIRDWLETNYAENTAEFEKNFNTLQTDLINLDAQYQALATSNEVNNKVIRFVSMTACFGNWQKTYGFQVYPIMLSKYGALPNEVQLKLIEERIRNDGVKYIVYESNMTDDMLELYNRIEDDLGLTRVEISNLSSLTKDDTDAGKDYLSIMYENLNVLQTMVEDRPDASSAGSEETTEQTQPSPTENAS